MFLATTGYAKLSSAEGELAHELWRRSLDESQVAEKLNSMHYLIDAMLSLSKYDLDNKDCFHTSTGSV